MMRNNRIQKTAVLLLLLLLCASIPFRQTTAAEHEAENLSKQCTYDGDFKVYAERLKDDDFDTALRVKKGKTLTISWKDGVPVASVFLSFYFAPVDYTVLQYDGSGTLLSEQNGVLLYNNLIETLPETRKVAIRADADDCAFCSLYAYGDGTVTDYHPFRPTVEKADFMTFAMHPDDEVLFLGAVYPIYEAQRGLSGLSVIMSTKLPEKNQRLRRQEDMNGAWTLGMKTQPIFGGFPDIPQDYYNKFKHTFTVDDVKRYVTTMIRIYRPEVVVTQDVNGEYGHWQHKTLSAGVQEAVKAAADANYQPKGYPKYEPWDVKKLYIHLYDRNKLTLDVDAPIAALGGKSAFEAATEAYQWHASQTKKNNHFVSVKEYSIAEFGLAYTAVGEDTDGVNDMFEHIDPMTLSVTPTPEPTPEPTETPAPTATPEPTDPLTPEPTAEPTAAPTDTPEPTDVPSTPEPVETPAPQEPRPGSDMWILFAGGGLLLLLVILLIALLIVRKRR